MLMSSFLKWFAHPQALLLLLALAALSFFAGWAWLRRRRGWRLLGISPTRVPQSSRLAGQRLLRGLLIAAGLLLVGVAAAGPQWGREKTDVVSAARDLVVVMDVSRSMLAETPSRQMRAQRMLSDLAHTLRARGGHRIALVVFAAQAQLVVPLTTDYDLFEVIALQQDAARLPPELRPGKDGSPSGTRLGAGLQRAVAAHDPKYQGSQVILLFSDGDDPAGDDEWKEGANAARRAGIPVFVVGVGDPTKPSNIRIGDNSSPLTHDGQPVETTMNEELLKEIARRTDGTYFPVRTQSAVGGTLFSAILEAAAAVPREAPPADDYHLRFRWLLTPGLALLVVSLLIGDRRGWRGKITEEEIDLPPQAAEWWSRTPTASQPSALPQDSNSTNTLQNAVVVALLAVVLIGAAPQVENPLHQGNEAFHNKDYPAALKYYEQAEESAADPGLVAFNKGATLIRLGRLREAELCYLRCLQDRDIPLQRRLRSLYDLGTALLQRGADTKDAAALHRAVECFELCFKETTDDPDFMSDVEHNLELARMFWFKVRAEAKAPDDQSLNPKEFADPRHRTMPQGAGDDFGANQKDLSSGTGEQGKPGEKDAPGSDKDMPGSGTVETLPDTDQLQPLDPADARELLAREIRRIEREQAQGPAYVRAENNRVKDW
jgi:Ca-activated chloride channel homolog